MQEAKPAQHLYFCSAEHNMCSGQLTARQRKSPYGTLLTRFRSNLLASLAPSPCNPKGRTSWYQLGTQLVPVGHQRVPSWYQLVANSYQLGTRWYPVGTSWYQLVPSWYQLVPAGTSWYPAGTSWYQLVPSWYQLGSLFSYENAVFQPSRQRVDN